MDDNELKFVSNLAIPTESKILLLVADGLGGLPSPAFGHRTELETAATPNLDQLVSQPTTATGLIYPVARGITPGSGPGHLGLFGYDPLSPSYQIGRGALEAAGLEFDLRPNDLIFRMNFCQAAVDGTILDRRAGRLSTQESSKLCKLITQSVTLVEAEAVVIPSRDYRAVLVLRSHHGLSDRVSDTDPQREGQTSLTCAALDHDDPLARRTANLVNTFVEQCIKTLSGQPQANMILLRGASRIPSIPQFGAVYRLKAAAAALYPLYRGVARLVGMDLLNGATNLEEEIGLVRSCLKDYTFFFVHYKDADSAGEDGNFLGKVRAIEYLDKQLPALLDMNFDVIAITGDHSTPSIMKGHSWHSVPLAVSGRYVRRDDSRRLTEHECAKGGLGRVRSRELMRILMANSGKLRKFGA